MGKKNKETPKLETREEIKQHFKELRIRLCQDINPKNPLHQTKEDNLAPWQVELQRLKDAPRKTKKKN